MDVFQNTSTSKKEEPKAPPFLYQEVILALAASIYAGGGFGNKFYTEVAFLISVALLLVRAKRWMIPIVGVILVSSVLLPPLIQSPFLLAAVFLHARRTTQAILILLGSALQLFAGFNPFYLPLFLLPLAIWALFYKRPADCKAAKAVVIALVFANIAPALVPQKAPVAQQSFEFPYRIDVAKNTEDVTRGKTYSSIDDHGDRVNADILVLEHDPGHGFATFNWSQKRLWTQNQYYGSALLRIATSLDGYLFSNLGCRVVNSGMRLLGEAHQGEFNSFISKSTGKLIFSDSDFLTNGAIGYQDHLAHALFRRFSYAHLILYGTAIGLMLALWKKTGTTAMIMLAALSVSALFALHNRAVDIRIVDDRAPWPHSHGIGGIASAVDQEQGIQTVGRMGNARILGIARDSSATHKSENVIVMEGGARVTVDGITFEASDYPLGLSDGIIDAIPIRRVGSEKTGRCILKTEHTTLIGTNSARMNWKRINDASK